MLAFHQKVFYKHQLVLQGLALIYTLNFFPDLIYDAKVHQRLLLNQNLTPCLNPVFVIEQSRAKSEKKDRKNYKYPYWKLSPTLKYFYLSFFVNILSHLW